MRTPARSLLRLRFVWVLLLVVTRVSGFASSRSNNEMILLERVSSLMERFKEEHGRLPANWAEIKQAPSGLEEMLTSFESYKHYKFEDRYVFPSKPIRASMQTPEGVGHPRWVWGSVATAGCILALLRLRLAAKSDLIEPGWVALTLNGFFLVHSVSQVF